MKEGIENNSQVPPLTNHYSAYRDNPSTSTPRMAKPHLESRGGRLNQFQIPSLTSPTSQIHQQETHTNYKIKTRL